MSCSLFSLLKIRLLQLCKIGILPHIYYFKDEYLHLFRLILYFYTHSASVSSKLEIMN